MRKHQLLRGELHKRGIEQRDLCKMLNPQCGETYLSFRMQGKAPWRSDHMYQIMEIIDQDISQLHRYFPPNGENVEKDFPTKRKIIDHNAIFAY